MSLSEEGPLVRAPIERAVVTHEVWNDIFYKKGVGGFYMDEFEQPEMMEVEFLYLLYKARVIAGVPFRVLASYDGDRNIRSAHAEMPCAAVDLQCLNPFERMRIVRAAIAVGFVRIGIYEGTYGEYKGLEKRDGGGIHLDASRHKPPGIWTRRTL